MGYLIRGKIRPENENPLNRLLIWIYHPVIKLVLKEKSMVSDRRRSDPGPHLDPVDAHRL